METAQPTTKVPKIPTNVFTFKIGGEAGFGIMSAGLLVSKLAARSGYYVFEYSEYPSLIRGGHNVTQISISDQKVTSQYQTTDLLIALNQETIDLHYMELVNGAIILCDPAEKLNFTKVPKFVNIVEVPFLELIKKVSGSLVMRNMVAVGAAGALLDVDFKHLSELIDQEFGHKNTAVIEKNIQLCQLAYDHIKSKYEKLIKPVLKQKQSIPKQIIVTGNEASALGSIAGGMNFFSIYPMTPTSGIMHTLAPLQEKYNFVYKQPEDEIAAINMAIGAGFAGARAMVATSGGGFCLMSEGLGLAGITETPLVIIEGMRGAPATGLPTWTEQGDLQFVLHAHQGDFPRIVIAPSDIEDTFYTVANAFNLAEKYQCPVIILIDKYICETYLGVTPFETKDLKINRGKFNTNLMAQYQRYANSSDGISIRTVPGSGNFFIANSDEHTQTGFSSEEKDMRLMQMKKRMQKMKTCEKDDMEKPQLIGPLNAELTIVSWGSNKGPILEALKYVENVNYLHLKWANPFPSQEVKKLLSGANKILNLECNYSGQMASLIREKTGIEITNNFLKYDGRPFYPEEIVNKINEVKSQVNSLL